MNHQPTWRYRFCSRLLSPLILIHLIWRTTRDGHWPYLKQRLGFVGVDRQARIHIHAASVGEVMTVLPLIEQLQRTVQSPAFLVTTNTPTGASILSKRLQGDATYAYLPLDFAGATKRFFKRLNISSVWLVETEVWPWLFCRAKQSGMPLVIINGRVGHKSQNKVAAFFDQTYRRALKDVRVLARSAEDAQRFGTLGAAKNHISVIGNLKFAIPNQSLPVEALLEQDYVLAASTHDDEELELARAWLNSSNNALLVIAPRHPERGAKLVHQLTQLHEELAPDLPAPVRRSTGALPEHNSAIYLADTLGELQQWYAHASAAFVGGSLIARGGHNVLEPARFATPIIVGEHTFNFAAEVNLLESVDGLMICQDATDVVDQLVSSMSHSQRLIALGKRANNVVNKQQAVVDDYCRQLTAFIPKK